MLKDDQIVAIASTQVWPKSEQLKTEREHGRKTSEIGFKVRLEFAEGVSSPIGIDYSAPGLFHSKEIKSKASRVKEQSV
jgi:hypothetical protein